MNFEIYWRVAERSALCRGEDIRKMTFLTHNCYYSNFSELPARAGLSGLLLIVTIYVPEVLRLKKKNMLPFIASSFKM